VNFPEGPLRFALLLALMEVTDPRDDGKGIAVPSDTVTDDLHDAGRIALGGEIGLARREDDRSRGFDGVHRVIGVHDGAPHERASHRNAPLAPSLS